MMRSNHIKRIFVLIMTAMLLLSVVFDIGQESFAGSRSARPSKVKIVNVSISGNKATIKWRKAKRAKKYQVFVKKGSGKYKKIKTLNKRRFVLKIKPGITYRVKIRGINKKSGKFSSPKRLYIPKGKKNTKTNNENVTYEELRKEIERLKQEIDKLKAVDVEESTSSADEKNPKIEDSNASSNIDNLPEDDVRSFEGLTPIEQAKRPEITFSFSEGSTVNGKRLRFWITATDSKGQNIPVYSNGSGSFTVWVNGTQVRSKSSSGNKTNFVIANPINGENKVRVKAEDSDGNTRTVTRTVNVNINGPGETVGIVSVTIEAPSIGLGTLAGPMDIPIVEEESCDEILEDAFAKAGLGYSMPKRDGAGAYLIGISRKDIAKNAEISEELQEKIEKVGGSPKPVIGNIANWPKDRIYEKDFVNTSGWMYFVNGDAPQVGLSSFVPEDGDEIRVVFTLLSGADL